MSTLQPDPAADGLETTCLGPLHLRFLFRRGRHLQLVHGDDRHVGMPDVHEMGIRQTIFPCHFQSAGRSILKVVPSPAWLVSLMVPPSRVMYS